MFPRYRAGMVFAAIGDTGYDIILYLHVLAAIVGFGSTFAAASNAVTAKKLQGAMGLGITKASKRTGDVLITPLTWLTGLLGFGVAGMSEDVYELSDTWLALSVILWLVGGITAAVVLKPAINKMVALQEELVAMGPPPEGAPAAGGPPPQVLELERTGRTIGMTSGVLHLMFLVILFLMVFKPGV